VRVSTSDSEAFLLALGVFLWASPFRKSVPPAPVIRERPYADLAPEGAADLPNRASPRPDAAGTGPPAGITLTGGPHSVCRACWGESPSAAPLALP